MSVKIIDLTAGGGTENVPVFNAYGYLLLLSSATFTSGWTIQSSGTPQDGMEVHIVYRGVAVFGVNTLTVYGKVVPTHLEGKPWEAVATYNGSTWNVVITADTTVASTIDALALTDASIATAKYIDSSVTFEKFESLVEGEIIIGNVSNVASALFAGGDAKMLIGNATTLTSVAISGDLAISNAGIAAIQPGVVTEAMLAFSLGNIQIASTILTQAQVLSLNTAPIEILADASVGAGNAVVVFAVAVDYNFADFAFAWSGDMEIQTASGALLASVAELDVENGSSKTWYVPQTTQRDMVKNSGLRIQAGGGGNPTVGGGDSTYKVQVFYSVVKFS